jgi:hypothetical protein
MKTTVIFLFLSASLLADVLKVDDKFPFHSFSDQFEKKLAITPQTKEIIISFSKKNGADVKAFLESHKGYLKQNQAVYLADMTSAPSLAMSLFMKPALKKYDFSVGLIEDDDIAEKLPKREGKTTVISLEKMLIKSIKFVDRL